MNQKLTTWSLGLHAGLLLLASTSFSVVSWLWGNWSWTWSYFQYSYRNGWGFPYQSDYSLAVVLAYLAAYLLGIVAYALAWRDITGVWKALGMILSALGLLSFLIEGSHWLWSHHLSCIFAFPAASLLLAVVAIIQLNRPNRIPYLSTPHKPKP